MRALNTIMYIFLKSKLDVWTHSFSQLLKIPKYLAIYLAIKWLINIALIYICIGFALYGDNPYPLILVVVAMPKIVMKDYKLVSAILRPRA